MKLTSTIIAAGFALVLQGAFAGAYANATGGHCTGMTVTDYVSSDVNQSTSSTAWVNITDGQLNFTTPATGCVVVTFSGLAFDSPNTTGVYQYLYVRTLLDGHNLCVPALTNDTFAAAQLPSPLTATSITRICKNVAAGAHSIQAQMSVNSSAGTSYVTGHQLTVTHN